MVDIICSPTHLCNFWNSTLSSECLCGYAELYASLESSALRTVFPNCWHTIVNQRKDLKVFFRISLLNHTALLSSSSFDCKSGL